MNELHKMDRPICLSLWIHPSERAVLVQNVLSIHMNEKHRVVVYTEPMESAPFPINLLRNLCIRQIITSHYVVLDADMMPSDNLYSSLLAIPSDLLNKDSYTFVIPPIFLHPGLVLSSCSSFQTCSEKYV